MRALVVSLAAVLSCAAPGCAGTLEPAASFLVGHAARDPWRIDWSAIDRPRGPAPLRLAAADGTLPQPQDEQPLHAAAIEHSDGYQTRAKIHKYASFATLPLFAAEVALGQSMYNSGTSDGKKGAHAAIGAGIISLFGVNTVTGAWNLFGEGWQDKDGRTLRVFHGLLMMAADVGFVATWANAPHSGLRHALTYENDKVVHRNMAVASVSVGTAGYLLMLFANHH